MKKMKINAAIVMLLALVACHKSPITEVATVNSQTPTSFTSVVTPPTTVLFKTGFDNSAMANQDAQNDYISGSNITNYAWNDPSPTPFFNDFKIYYESGTTTARKAYITKDDVPAGSPPSTNNILKFSISDATYPITFGTYRFKQRIQADLFDFKDPVTSSETYGENLKEFYQKVDIKLHYTSFQRLLADTNRLVSGSSDWLTLFEEFNGITDFSDHTTAYRVGMGLKKSTDGQHFLLSVTGQKGQPGTEWNATAAENWEISSTTFYIEPGKWYTYEIYMKEGLGNTGGTGRVWVKITNIETNAIQYLGSTTTPKYTQSPVDATSNGFKYIYPLKLYTSGDVIKAVNPHLDNPSATAISLQAYYDNYWFYNTKP